MELRRCKKCKHLRYVDKGGMGRIFTDHICKNANERLIQMIDPIDCHYKSNFLDKINLIIWVVGLLTLISFFEELMNWLRK